MIRRKTKSFRNLNGRERNKARKKKENALEKKKVKRDNRKRKDNRDPPTEVPKMFPGLFFFFGLLRTMMKRKHRLIGR